MGNTSSSQSLPAGKIGYVANMLGSHDARTIHSDIFENLIEVDILLGVRVDQIVEVVPGDGQDRLAVHFGIVQAVEQMDATRAGSGHADAEPASVLGIGTGHERGSFLVSHLQKTNFLLALPRSDSMMPLIPSPGNPNMISTPQCSNASAKMSPPVLAMIASFTFE